MGTELQGISLTVFRTVLMSSHYIFTKLLQCDPDYFEAIIHIGGSVVQNCKIYLECVCIPLLVPIFRDLGIVSLHKLTAGPQIAKCSCSPQTVR